jgi:O-antigen/teichoic acid export membrane protein
LWQKVRLRAAGFILPVNAQTESLRAKGRERRIVLTAAASTLAKTASISAALITMPAALGYLGHERFGLWMTISSLAAFLAFADLGLGNGLVNAIASAGGRDDEIAIRRYVTSGLAMLVLFGGLILSAFFLYAVRLPWADIFRLKSELARSEATVAVGVFVLCFAIGVPAALAMRVQSALQSGFLGAAWQAAGSALAVVGLMLAIEAEASLPLLVLALVGSPVLANVLNSIVFFLFQRADLRPRISDFSFGDAKHLISLGAMYLVLQVVAAGVYASDSLIIANTLGTEAVADYAVPERVYALVGISLSMLLSPLWPAYGDALARGDSRWVGRTVIRSLMFSAGISSLAAFGLFLFAPVLINLWIGGHFAVPTGLLAALSVWKIIEGLGIGLAVFMNGVRIVRAQLVMALATAAVAIPLKFVLVQSVGVSGPVWATVCAYSVLTLLPASYMLYRFFGGDGRRMQR